MIDREKVIKALSICVPETQEDSKLECSDCPYGDVCNPYDIVWITLPLIWDIRTMLKEQEVVKPKTGHWIWLQYCANEGVYCSECQTKMFNRYPMKKKLSQFCGHCGAKMGDEVERL